jgi:hypothetical protein
MALKRQVRWKVAPSMKRRVGLQSERGSSQRHTCPRPRGFAPSSAPERRVHPIPCLRERQCSEHLAERGQRTYVLAHDLRNWAATASSGSLMQERPDRGVPLSAPPPETHLCKAARLRCQLGFGLMCPSDRQLPSRLRTRFRDPVWDSPVQAGPGSLPPRLRIGSSNRSALGVHPIRGDPPDPDRCVHDGCGYSNRPAAGRGLDVSGR